MRRLLAITVERTQASTVILRVPEGWDPGEHLTPEELLRACQQTIREDEWETAGWEPTLRRVDTRAVPPEAVEGQLVYEV